MVLLIPVLIIISLEAAVGVLGETILCPPSDTIQRRRAWSKLSQIIYLTNEACRMHSELSVRLHIVLINTPQ